MSKEFKPSTYENKWQEKWAQSSIYKTQNIPGRSKFYSLYSYPYPSGAGLHVGHVEGMVANDIVARFERMNGKNVLFPMGWDSFGLPAENYAIKTGVHPQISTDEAVETFKEQINRAGVSVDWETEVGAHWPEYYRWTQWIFLQMFKKGVAYKKNAPVNWCPKDQTVLANEQVIDGKCERCESEVIQKEMDQWFYKITDYAERLDKDLDDVDWPESTKTQQRHWIGKSEGTEVSFFLTPSQLDTEPPLSRYTCRGARGEVYAYSKENRRTPTKSENILWQRLRNNQLGFKFRRQHAVENYIADFYCAEKRLIIELDGNIHDFTKVEDAIRTDVLTDKGYHLIRFSNDEVEKDSELVINKILNKTSEIKTNNFEKDRNEKDRDEAITVFTTRVDTIFGATFLVVAPEHKIVRQIIEKHINAENFDEIINYVNAAKNKTNLERQTQKEKTGVEIIGLKAINPFNSEEVPIFIADYALADYGTGALMGVPAHDERDNEFAKKYNIEIREVIAKEYGERKDPHEFVDEVSIVVFNKSNNKYLMLRWPTGLGTIIGGGKEAGETNYDAVVRELKEEAGIIKIIEEYTVVETFYSNYWHKIKNGQRRGKGSFHLVIIDDSCIEESKTAHEEHEKFKLEWCSADEMLQEIINIGENEHWIYGAKRAVTKNTELGYDKNYDKTKFAYNIITDYGVLFNSGEYSDLTSPEAIEKMQNWLEENNLGKKVTTYRIRDWLLSRQRYWGSPIPVIKSEKAAEAGYGYIPEKKLNILVIHGLGSEGLKGWRVGLKKEMEDLGHKVFTPNMPKAKTPDFNEWMSFIESEYSDLFKSSENLVIVGHSLGGYLAFKLAEKHKFAKIITIAAAPYINPIILRTIKSPYDIETTNALEKFNANGGRVKRKLVKANVNEIVIINSEDDPLITPFLQRYYKKKFAKSAFFKDFKDKKHFSTGDLPNGFEELYPFINIKNNTKLPGIFPVQENVLPVILPYNVDFKPTGESPLVNSEEFHSNVVCPIFGTPAKREVDTMDTFVDSSWYFFRHTDAKNEKEIFETPIKFSKYNFGSEHGFTKSLENIVNIFDTNKIDYAVFGSMATAIMNRDYHREIPDIDIFITKNSESRFREILKSNNSIKDLSNNEDTIIELDGVVIKIIPQEWDQEVLNKRQKIFFKGFYVYVAPIDLLLNHYRSICADDAVQFYESQNTITNQFLPTDLYMIGTEHIVLHLLYARFFTKFLHDVGAVKFHEPFYKMRHMGLIQGPDGRKMSKRWGNVINPNDEIDKYGADALRMYEMFMGPLEDAKPWNDRAEMGVFRFLAKVWKLSESVGIVTPEDLKKQEIEVNKLNKKITEDINRMSFNTAVAKFMEFINFIQGFSAIDKNVFEKFLLILAPFAPFIAEELWSKLGNEFSIHQQQWPVYLDLKEELTSINVSVQVNGKFRGILEVNPEIEETEIVNLAKQDSKISKYLDFEVKKIIYIKGKVLSING